MTVSAQGSRIRLLSVSTCLALGAALLTMAAPAVAATGNSSTNDPMSAAAAAAADKALPQHKAGTLIVGYSPTATDVQKGAARVKSGAKSAKRLTAKGPNTAEVVTLAPGESVSAAIAKFKSSPGVRYAEPDYVLTKQVTSNDPYYTGGNLWGMYGDGTSPANQFGSAAGEAWAAGYTGSRSVAIGVIDEGIQFAHPDLAANMWTNPLEIAGNGIDDDANGFIDDIHGWDFINNNATVYDGNSTEGSDTHGTHVSGTIGGIGGNGSGVAGVNWAVTIVSAKFLGANGGSTSDAVRALDYLRALKVSQGLKIVATSNSWGGGGYSTALNDAINLAGDQGILFVAAAGNSSSNNDVVGSYPSNNQCTNGGTRGYDCVIAVGSITSSGALSSFSSYGATTVDIAAPGSSINSAYPVDGYASLSGTSMATPHVSGAIALCASINPSLTAGQLRAAVVNSAQSTPSLAGLIVNGGRLDIGAMVSACLPSTSPVVGDPTALAATATSTTNVSLTWSDTAANETAYDIERAPFASSVCGTFTRVATTGAGATAFTVGSLSPSTDYCFRVRASNTYLGGSSTVSSSVTVRTLDPPAPYLCTSTTYAWVDKTAGTPATLTLTDDSSTIVSLPFSASFYGTTYNSAQVSSNGYLRLGTGAATAYSNVGIPTTSDPNNFVAPWWDDLNPTAGGTIWTLVKGSAPNRQFVVTWDNVAVFSVAGSGVTMQALIDEGTGDITFQYLDALTGSTASDNGASATIGVENADGTAGTQVGFNQAVVSSGSARRCSNSSATGPTVSTGSLPVGTTGVAYSQTLTASGGTAPYTWSVATGTLAAGLSL
ncbi:MAG: S8 family serine peptidase, partial [Actinobacteria bacterium]|nr:S8 family serine peptidase [Actinomycetota bacterium]